MIRDARFGDIPRIVGMLEALHKRSRYADVCGFEGKLARSMVFQSIQRHGGTAAGATCAFVAEKAGEVQGFLLGVLQPVYLLGDKLEAQDAFFHCTPAAEAGDASRLIEAFTAWAECNPAVVAAKLSATDVVESGTARIEKLFRRKGYAHAGVIYERATR